MDDGCWTGSGIRIATNSFQLEDIERLSQVLNLNYNLKTTIQKVSLRSSSTFGKIDGTAVAQALLPSDPKGKEVAKQRCDSQGAGKILYSLYIKKQSVDNIRKILLPHMHSSMFYKLGIDNLI